MPLKATNSIAGRERSETFGSTHHNMPTLKGSDARLLINSTL